MTSRRPASAMRADACVPLVETTRGAAVENIHFGSIAVVDRTGRLVYRAGDPDVAVFTRSTLKPFQALPLMLAGGADHFGFDQPALALLCASHSGEAMHLAVVRDMLARAACTVEQLQCGCQVPLRFGSLGQTPPADAHWSALHNNCSGKHAGFLAWCRWQGQSTDDYLAFGHPLQRRIREVIATLADLPEDQLIAGVDGCSAPNYALPLTCLALLYALLADDSSSDEAGQNMQRLFAAMTRFPELVSGTRRNDLDFMQAAPGDLVAKVGADGVQAIGIRSRGLGIAIKISDGDRRALCTAAVEVLRQLGVVEAVHTTSLAAWAAPGIANLRGMQTGSVRACFKLVSM